ncbi:MAG TPA: divalent-cation tolerance protein CutA [Nitrospirota bacterium]|nr:divalent-cation tolerance protein CutA [Nitrospirota bacterium]
MPEEIIVFITASSGEEAAAIAEALVNEHLAACVNIVPEVRSLFFWEGKAQDAREALLICKSRQPLLEKLISLVKSLHSYTVPEVIALPIIAGSREYLDWIRESTKG